MNKKEFIMLSSLKKVFGTRNSKLLEASKSKKLFEPAIDESNAKIRQIESIYDYCTRNGIKILSNSDKDYPRNLKRITNSPPILYCRGDITLLNKRSVSIVGSRESSKDSMKWAYDLAKDLIEKDIVLVSGGAKGIDAAVHKAAVDFEGKTICVVGTGFDNLYPNENKEIFDQIAKKGLIISEIEPSGHVNKFSLLERNRITSGISDGILIVTSKINGGSMEQFKTAQKQMKKVFVPKKDLYPSDGIEAMISSKAIPIESSDDIIREVYGSKAILRKNEKLVYS